MSQKFTGKTRAEAEAKADAWTQMQEGLKNVRKRTYIFRPASVQHAPKGEGIWIVAIHYEQEP
jgi:hypothetical protein